MAGPPSAPGPADVSTTTTTTTPLRRLDEARFAPLSLAIGEADVYLVAEALLGQRRTERFEQPPQTPAPSATLTLALARLLPIGLLRFIGAQGGERAGRVLRRRGDRVVLIDVALGDDDAFHVDLDDDAAFSLRVSSAWPTAVWQLARDVMPLVQPRPHDRGGLRELDPAERHRLLTSSPPAATLSGDHLAPTPAIASPCLTKQVSQLPLAAPAKSPCIAMTFTVTPTPYFFWATGIIRFSPKKNSVATGAVPATWHRLMPMAIFGIRGVLTICSRRQGTGSVHQK